MESLAEQKKLVLIINTDIAVGLIANTTAVLTLSVGAKHPELIGPDLQDGSGQPHMGITTITIPILGADDTILTGLVHQIKGKDIELVSFSKIAQSIHSYEEYPQKLSQTLGEEIQYSGIALYGPKLSVNTLVGSLPRLK